ncbi:MAG: hypothetical protein Q7J38_07830 [Gallionella sp.]|nr:hypothetical protein [Gallionella sp.]
MAIVPLRPYQSLTTIVFIDGSLADLQTILTGLQGQAFIPALASAATPMVGRVILGDVTA